MRQAENIAAGRGLTGKLMKGLMGSENAAKIGDSMASARNAQAAAALQAQGLPTIPATVISLTDTGKLINFDPVVDLVASFDSGEQVTLHTLVSKLQIPREGDRILLMRRPQQDDQCIYAGMA